jgi:hypothetical protein
MQVYVKYDFEAPRYQLPKMSSDSAIDPKELESLIKPYLEQTLAKIDNIQAFFEQKIDSLNNETNKGNAQQTLSESNDAKDVDIELIQKTERINNVFKENHFTSDHMSSKATEFVHSSNKEIIYLLPNKKEITIVMNPETIKDSFKSRGEERYSTGFRKFPKQINKGKTPINYGYSFKFKVEDELNAFLKEVLAAT